MVTHEPRTAPVFDSEAAMTPELPRSTKIIAIVLLCGVLVAIGAFGLLAIQHVLADEPTKSADIARLENRGFTNVKLIETGDGTRPSVFDVQVGESTPACILTITLLGGADGPTYDGRTDVSVATLKANAAELGLTHCFTATPQQ